MKRALSSSPALFPLLLLGCSHGSNPVPAPPPSVRAAVVQSVSTPTPQLIQTAGTVHAKETAVISAQIPGRIRRVLVEAGDRVVAGQLLVTLDNAAMQSALDQATAGASAAEKQQAAAQTQASLAAQTLKRYQILKEQKSVSPQEFDEIEMRSQAAELQRAASAAQSDQAMAAVAGARAQLSYTALDAPFAGIVTARMADPGTLAAPGMPVLQIDREGPLQVYTTVDESLIGSVRAGMQVPVTVEGIDAANLSGAVAEIVPAADPASRSFLVKLDLPAVKGLRAGMYATAGFPGASRAVILVPQSAVVMRGSLACVYALDANGVAQLRYVTLGIRQGAQVEILSGLGAGENLVNQPGDRDLAGRRIEPAIEAQR
ncbi:MAG TPA: efflux RND transporter periplasmic adaptor subunit [Acidobacteriaceae bacterium]|jgi:RND family efflux transporter MFP subunit|nr:efflux RND transporter periplasmic adaptor subunit [Acidobacteriaceae bacterium]